MALLDTFKRVGDLLVKMQGITPGGLNFAKGASDAINLYKSAVDKKKTIKEKSLAVANVVPGATLAKAVGTGLAMPQVTAAMTNAEKNRTLLNSEIIKGFNTAKTTEQKQKFADLAVSNRNYDPSGELKQLIAEAPTTKQILMSAGELALLASTGYKPYLPTKYISPSQVRNIKEVVNISKGLSEAESVRKYGNAAKLFNKFIAPTTKAAGEAGAFFALAEGANNADASVNDILKQGLIGAGVGAGLTAGSIGLVAGLKTAAPIVKEAGVKFMAGVEKAAKPTESGLVGNTAVEKVTNLAGGLKPTLKQRAAQDVLQTVQDVQRLKTKFVDRYSAFKRIQDRILSTKGGGQIKQDEKIYNNVRVLDSISDNTAETKITGLMDKLDQFKDIQPDYKAFITNLDLIERSKLGQKTAGGATTQQLVDNLRQLAQEAGPEKMSRLNQARQIINDYHQDWLKARVDAGLISQATVDVLNKAHPNYIPHNVITDVEEQVFNAMSASLNVPKTDIMKAVGSLGNIQDPIDAIALRTQIASRVVEKNKLLNNLVRAQEKYNVIPGMKPLQTAERVKARQALFEEFGALKDELQTIKNSVSNIKDTTGGLNSKINKANTRIRQMIDDFLAKPDLQRDTELFSEIKNEVDHAFSVTTGRSLKAEGKKVLEHISPDTFDAVVEYVNKSKGISDAAKVKFVDDFQKGIARNGKITFPPSIAGTPFAEDLNAIVTSGRQDIVDELLAKYQPGRSVPAVKMATKDTQPVFNAVKNFSDGKSFATSVNVDPEVMPKIEDIVSKYTVDKNKSTLENFYDLVKFGTKNNSAYGLNGRILSQKFDIASNDRLINDANKKLDIVLSNLESKKATMSSIWDEIKSLSAIKNSGKEQTINLFRDGIKETWVVPQDLAVAIKNLDTPVMPKLFNMAVAPGNLLKRWTTQYNLSFSLPNLFRDKQTAAVTAQGFIDDMAKQFGAVPKDISKMTREDILKLYKESGGYGSSIFSEGQTAMLKNLKDRGIVTQLSDVNPLNLVEKINSSLEQNTRLNVFKEALAKGLTPQDAALASRDATIDFAKMGSWMRPLNRAIPFLNARLQGFANMGAAVAKNPEMFARMQLFTSVYPTMLLHQYNSRFDSYKNISQKIKDKYWVIITGETKARDENTGEEITVPQMITVPKGEGQALVSGPIGYFLDKLDGVDPRKVSKMIADTVGAASPVEFASYGNQGNWIASQISKFGPVGTIAAGEISNKQPYFGTSIVPESRTKASPYMQFKETTPEILKILGEKFTYKDKDGNKVGGISPAKLNFYIESLGGLPKDVKDSLETIYQTVTGGKGAKEKSLSQTTFGGLTKTPLTRSFAREAAPYYSPEAEVQRKLKTDITEISTNVSLTQKDRAREVVKELNKLSTAEEKKSYLNSIGSELNKEMLTQIQTIKKNNATVEALSKTDSNDIRARYTLSRLDQIDEEGGSAQDKKDFLIELVKAKILTKETLKIIAKLKLDATASSSAP